MEKLTVVIVITCAVVVCSCFNINYYLRKIYLELVILNEDNESEDARLDDNGD